MNLETVLFLVLGGVALAAAIAMVITRNMVHSALFMVVVFLATAVLYLIYQAPLIAMLQTPSPGPTGQQLSSAGVSSSFSSLKWIVEKRSRTTPNPGTVLNHRSTRTARRCASGCFSLSIRHFACSNNAARRVRCIPSSTSPRSRASSSRAIWVRTAS